MNKKIPIHEYVKKHSTSAQNVYRWIREGKYDEHDYCVIERVVKRIMIDENAIPSHTKHPL